MIWGRNKRGEDIGLLHWTYEYLVHRHQRNVLSAEILKAANKVKRTKARSLVIIIECTPREEEEEHNDQTSLD